MYQNDDAIEQYVKAVELQPGYVSAWNNLGDAYEKAQDMRWTMLIVDSPVGWVGSAVVQDMIR